MTKLEVVLQLVLYHLSLIIGSLAVLGLLVYLGWELVELIFNRLKLTKEVAIWASERKFNRTTPNGD